MDIEPEVENRHIPIQSNAKRQIPSINNDTTLSPNRDCQLNPKLNK